MPPSPRDGRMRTADGFSRHSRIETTCSMSPGSIRVHSTRATRPFCYQRASAGRFDAADVFHPSRHTAADSGTSR